MTTLPPSNQATGNPPRFVLPGRGRVIRALSYLAGGLTIVRQPLKMWEIVSPGLLVLGGRARNVLVKFSLAPPRPVGETWPGCGSATPYPIATLATTMNNEQMKAPESHLQSLVT
jgi:hypothetical protein